MSDQRPPARPWYDLVTETIALKGWTKAQLADRAGISRPTVDNWRTNPRAPQARSVNAVADVLGISRDRALRLAGVIAEAQPEPLVDPQLADALRRYVPVEAEETIARLEQAEAERRRQLREEGEGQASQPAG
jgi:transcriptional regulator with XRE-family HTH domain